MESRSLVAAAAPGGPQPTAEAAEPTWPEVDRRRTPDRRNRPTSLWQSLTGPRRRRQGRRRGETRDAYVDHYTWRDLSLLLAIFVLNLVDAHLTLRLLDRGGEEANPLMQQLLRFGDETFLLQKCILVGFLLLVLVVHKNFRLARLGLWVLLFFYTGLVGYHLQIIAQLG